MSVPEIIIPAFWGMKTIVVRENTESDDGNRNVPEPNQEKLWGQPDLIFCNFAIELNY